MVLTSDASYAPYDYSNDFIFLHPEVSHVDINPGTPTLT